MAYKLDVVHIVDVESSCWNGVPPAGQISEIIEIGIVRMSLVGAYAIQKEDDLLIAPTVSKISPFCTELTTLTTEMLQGGISFPNAIDALVVDFNTPNHLWASYGEYDRTMFQRQCTARNIQYPFGYSHVNVKTLYALAAGLTKEVGMAKALEQLGLPLEGTHHRANSDAKNIAKIFAWCLKRLQDVT